MTGEGEAVVVVEDVGLGRSALVLLLIVSGVGWRGDEVQAFQRRTYHYGHADALYKGTEQ